MFTIQGGDVVTKQYNSKKEQFLQKPQKRKTIMLLIVAAVAVIGAGVIFTVLRQPGQAGREYFGDPVAAPRSYIGRVVEMSKVTPIIADGRVKIPLAEVEEYNIVSFELENDQGLLVPLMAYITPSGRLFAGSSMCEPCRGRTYSLAGETIVCGNCRTTFDIEDHEFISGAAICGSYAPVYMNPVIEDGMVTIDMQKILNWRIRAL
jgi:nitrite reductase/ring-hydroxylating ferredoxin subunit